MNEMIKKSIILSLLTAFSLSVTLQAPPLETEVKKIIEQEGKAEKEKKDSLIKSALKYGALGALTIAIAYSIPETREVIDRLIIKFGFQEGVNRAIQSISFTGCGPEYILKTIKWMSNHSTAIQIISSFMGSLGAGARATQIAEKLPWPVNKALEAVNISVSYIIALITPLASLGTIGKSIIEHGLSFKIMTHNPNALFTLGMAFLPYLTARFSMPSEELELPAAASITTPLTEEESKKLIEFFADPQILFLLKVVTTDELVANNHFESLALGEQEKEILMAAHGALSSITDALAEHFKSPEEKPQEGTKEDEASQEELEAELQKLIGAKK